MSIFNPEADYRIAPVPGAGKTARVVRFFLLPQGKTVEAQWTIIRDLRAKATFTYEFLTVWQFQYQGQSFSLKSANDASRDQIIRAASTDYLYLGDAYFPKNPEFFPRRANWTSDLDALPHKIESLQGNTFAWENGAVFGSELYAEYRISYCLKFDLTSLKILFAETFHSTADCHID